VIRPRRASGTPRFERWWLLAWAAGWSAVFVIALVDVGFQRVLRGSPFLTAWTDASNLLLVTSIGAALTPLVFAAFRRWAPGTGPLRSRAPLYAGVAVAFWLSWAVAHALLGEIGAIRLGDSPLPFRDRLPGLLAAHGFNSLILFGVMVALYEAVQYTRAARRQEVRASALRAELSRAEMAALGAQLDPHFFFNTLHVVSGLMGRDVASARRVLDDLGELLRGSLAHHRARLVPLSTELRLVERYTAIQRARFGERLEVEFSVDEQTLGLRVPPLLLQPLVENAIHHGVARLPEGGRVSIGAARADGELTLTVADSGAGFARRRPEPPRERIGIGGTRARLALIFGEEASLDFTYPESGGFAAAVRLPAVEEGGGDAD
jgi:two-component system, LytTR family, sensor kinase